MRFMNEFVETATPNRELFLSKISVCLYYQGGNILFLSETLDYTFVICKIPSSGNKFKSTQSHVSTHTDCIVPYCFENLTLRLFRRRWDGHRSPALCTDSPECEQGAMLLRRYPQACLLGILLCKAGNPSKSEVIELISHFLHTVRCQQNKLTYIIN